MLLKFGMLFLHLTALFQIAKFRILCLVWKNLQQNYSTVWGSVRKVNSYSLRTGRYARNVSFLCGDMNFGYLDTTNVESLCQRCSLSDGIVHTLLTVSVYKTNPSSIFSTSEQGLEQNCVHIYTALCPHSKKILK